MRRKYRATMPSWKSERRKSMPPADRKRYRYFRQPSRAGIENGRENAEPVAEPLIRELTAEAAPTALWPRAGIRASGTSGRKTHPLCRPDPRHSFA